MLLWNFEKVLNKVYGDNPEIGMAKALWSAFSVFLTTALEGCKDDDPEDCKRHGRELRELAEAFIGKFKAFGGTVAPTVYMHEMLCHVEQQVSEYGSLTKFASQAIEAWHQITKDLVRNFSNADPKKTCGTVLKRALAWCNTEVLRNHKGEIQAADLHEFLHSTGNKAHLSKEKLKMRNQRWVADLEARSAWRQQRGAASTQAGQPA